MFLVKIDVRTYIFSLLERVFLEARAAVDWLAYRRLERHRSGFATVTTFNLKHPFLQCVKITSSALWFKLKMTISNYHRYDLHGRLKRFRL